MLKLAIWGLMALIFIPLLITGFATLFTVVFSLGMVFLVFKILFLPIAFFFGLVLFPFKLLFHATLFLFKFLFFSLLFLSLLTMAGCAFLWFVI